MGWVYLGHSTVAKKGWDLISSTPPTPAPSLSVGLYWSSCTGAQDRNWREKKTLMKLIIQMTQINHIIPKAFLNVWVKNSTSDSFKLPLAVAYESISTVLHTMIPKSRHQADPINTVYSLYMLSPCRHSHTGLLLASCYIKQREIQADHINIYPKITKFWGFAISSKILSQCQLCY